MTPETSTLLTTPPTVFADFDEKYESSPNSIAATLVCDAVDHESMVLKTVDYQEDDLECAPLYPTVATSSSSSHGEDHSYIHFLFGFLAGVFLLSMGLAIGNFFVPRSEAATKELLQQFGWTEDMMLQPEAKGPANWSNIDTFFIL